MGERCAVPIALWGGLQAAACGAGPSPHADTRPTTAPSADPGVFLAERPPGGEDMLSEIRGKLVLDDRGCLRVRRDGASPTIVWPTGFEARKANGEVKVVDGKGKTVARVGREVLAGGGEGALEGTEIVDTPTRRELRERCSGSYWVAAPPVRMPRP